MCHIAIDATVVHIACHTHCPLHKIDAPGVCGYRAALVAGTLSLSSEGGTAQSGVGQVGRASLGTLAVSLSTDVGGGDADG